MSYPKELKNLKISVIGARKSGLGAAVFLKNLGNTVFVSDIGQPENPEEATQLFRQEGISWEFDGHTDAVFDCDLLVISPGVPSNAPVIVKANEKNIPVISEIEVGYRYFPHPVAAITGTNGKTTTTALTGHLLTVAGHRPLVAGNIGLAITATSDQWPHSTLGVLEVSSFQLDHIVDFKPVIAMILNITPDHQDRYQTFNHYARSKFRIAENQDEDGLFIYNADSDVIIPYLNEIKAQKWPFSTKKPLHFGAWLEGEEVKIQTNGEPQTLINIRELMIPGMHNVENAMAASLAAAFLGVTPEIIREGLKTFAGVEHRIEFIREWNGVKYYNDSKATNLDSTRVALDSFEGNIIWMAGGRDTGNDYQPIREKVKKKVKTIIAIGESAGKVEKSFAGIVPVVNAGMTMQTAVQAAAAAASPGDVVLFSPACKSFDMYKSYTHRGDDVKTLVKNLK